MTATTTIALTVPIEGGCAAAEAATPPGGQPRRPPAGASAPGPRELLIPVMERFCSRW